MSGRVVVSGSMSVYAAMLALRDRLAAHGLRCLIPLAEDERHAALTPIAFEAFKRSAARRYMKQISARETAALLVANVERRGEANYIGPNTLAEIAVAFHARKQIFLYCDAYAPYADELAAWRVVPLCGRLEPLLEALEDPRPAQLSLQVDQPSALAA